MPDSKQPRSTTLVLLSAGLFLLLFSALTGFSPTQAQPNAPGKQAYLPIMAHQFITRVISSSEWMLVVDDEHLVYDTVERAYHPFKKHPQNPVLVADQNWEGQIVQLYGTVLPGFRMWYTSLNAVKKTNKVLYAESPDGLRWTKPHIDEDGKNLVLGDANLVSVIHRPEDAAQPYKLMVNTDEAFYGFWSMDGIATVPYETNPLFSNGSDVAQFFWDPTAEQYRGTAKELYPVRGVLRRSVRFAQSLDFVQWEKLAPLFTPETLDDRLNPGYYTHFYGLSAFPAGEQYLGLLWVLEAPDVEGLYGKVHVQLVSSHDGLNWKRSEGERPPILALGPPGAWDDGQVYTAISPVVVGDEMWLYYSGCNQEHGARLLEMVCSIGLATAPYNRLVSLRGRGIVLTEYLAAPGGALHLNYAASSGGALRAELVRAGEPIPGYEAENSQVLNGDSLDAVVTWGPNTTLPDEPFQIRFYLEDSALYAFKLQEGSALP